MTSQSVLTTAVLTRDVGTQVNSDNPPKQIIRPWRELLRTWPHDPNATVEHKARRLLVELLQPGCADGTWRFLLAVWAAHPGYRTVEHLAFDLGVNVRTLASRFRRAGLPTPRLYLHGSRLVRIAHRFEHGATAQAVALELGTGFINHLDLYVRRHTGAASMWRWRKTVTGESTLRDYMLAYVTPYRATLRSFDPLTACIGWRGNGREQ